MSLRRTCRLIIKQLVLANELDEQNHTLIIKDKQDKIKQIPLTDCKNFKLNIEAEDNLAIQFTILHSHTQQYSAAGLFILEFKHLSTDQICQTSCQLVDPYSQQMGLLKLQLSLDDEKVSYNFVVKDSDNDDTEQWGDKSKFVQNNFSKISGKITRKRRHTYLLKDEHPRVIVNNKIISNKNVVIRNMVVKLDGLVETIILRDKKSLEFIGQVKCINNPSADELRQCSFKVPVLYNEIDIEVAFIDNNRAYGSLFFSVISEEGPKNVSIPMYDEDKNYQGNLYLSYHAYVNEQQVIGERQSLNAEILEKQQNLIQPHMLKYLHSQSQHQKYPTKLLPQKYRVSINRSTLVSKTVDQKIMPSKSNDNSPYYMYSPQNRTIDYETSRYQTIYGSSEKKRSINKQTERNHEELAAREKNLFLNRDHEEKLRQLEGLSQVNLRPRSKIYVIKISSVLINLYSIYFIKHNISMERDVCVGKFLNLYSSHAHVFRSEQVFASQNLAWKLRNCEIEIKQADMLTIQLCLSNDKSVIGESVIACIRLLASLNYNDYYKGQLMFNKQEIGQIIINLKILPLQRRHVSPQAPNQYYQAERQTNKVIKINQRLRLGLPRVKNSHFQPSNDREMRYLTPQNRNPRYATLEEIPQKRNKKRKFVFVRQ